MVRSIGPKIRHKYSKNWQFGVFLHQTADSAAQHDTACSGPQKAQTTTPEKATLTNKFLHPVNGKKF